MGRHGENIRKRKDGRWEARVIYTYHPDGKAKYHSIYGKSYLEVKEKRSAYTETNAKFCISKSETYQNKKKITFGQVMNEWLESKKDFVKESTLAHYTSLLNRHILPKLGEYYLSALSSEVINSFLREKLCSGRTDGKGGLSPKTVSDIRSILLLGLEYAKEQDYPCPILNKIFCPKSKQPHIQVMTRAEQAKLEEFLFAHPEPLELGILIALYGGLRIGEICALQWKDFHFDSGTIHVTKTMLRIQDITPNCQKKTKIIISHPKTEHSNRIIPMPSFLILFLKKYKMKPDVYILTGNQSFLEPRMCLDKYKQILNQVHLKSYTFHALRHTFATRCVESGFDIKSLSEILGHANVSTTLQRYVHPSIDLKKEQMNRLEKISILGQN